MEKAISNYDIIVQNLRDSDAEHLVYIAEFGHYSFVRLVGEDLYIAEEADNDRYWHRAVRKLSPAENTFLPLPVSYGGTTCSNLAATMPGAPTLPIWNEPELYPLTTCETTGTETFLSEPPDAYPTVDESVLPFVTCAEQNSETGFDVLEPQSISASRDIGSKCEEDRGCAKKSEFRNQKLVDADTGKAPTTATKKTVTASCYYSRKPVDRNSGKAVPRGTPNSVSSTVFRNTRLVHPETGELASRYTAGPITRALFYKRRTKRRKEEALRSQMAAKDNDNA
jgi:hypothetical protein